MSKLQVDDIVNKGDDGSVGFSRGAVITGVATATSFSGNLNATSATGVSTVGVLTAYSSIHINVGSGSTEVATELKAKASTGKAIAMSMVFG